MPDLSHLTAEERQIIESVLLRQREEEEKEQEILRYCRRRPFLFPITAHSLFRSASQRYAACTLPTVNWPIHYLADGEKIALCCEHLIEF